MLPAGFPGAGWLAGRYAKLVGEGTSGARNEKPRGGGASVYKACLLVFDQSHSSSSGMTR